MKKNKGFTLIEVLAVLVILSLLITFSVVSVNKIKKKQEVANRINVIRSILTAARAYEADYPETKNKISETDFNVYVSTLLEKGYVDFDQDKYSDLINYKYNGNSYNVYIKTNTNNDKREFVFNTNIKILNKNGTKVSIQPTDCGLETEQDSDVKGKKICVYLSCNTLEPVKCNGWAADGTAINPNNNASYTTAPELYK